MSDSETLYLAPLVCSWCGREEKVVHATRKEQVAEVTLFIVEAECFQCMGGVKTHYVSHGLYQISLYQYACTISGGPEEVQRLLDEAVKR